MKKGPRAGTLAGLVACFLLPVSVSCQSQTNQWSRYDGRWWIGAAPAERAEFIDGFADCYVFIHAGPARFEKTDYENELTRYFAGDPSHLKDPLYAVLPLLARGDTSLPRGAEIDSTAHGYYNGLYWRNVAHSASGRRKMLGFIEGYLACNHSVGHDGQGAFSKSPSTYLQLVNRWYQLDPTTYDMGGNEDAKVADVLVRFRDTPR